MSKRYISTIDDPSIVTAANLKALADTNPAMYPVGGQYVTVLGVLLTVTANTGTVVTVGTVTVV